MKRYLSALFEAWLTFKLALRGWRVSSYDLPVHPSYGRCVGTVHRWQPTYPGWKDTRGWRLSSEGISWPRTWTRPDFAIEADAPSTRRIARRLAKERASPTWAAVDGDE